MGYYIFTKKQLNEVLKDLTDPFCISDSELNAESLNTENVYNEKHKKGFINFLRDNYFKGNL